MRILINFVGRKWCRRPRPSPRKARALLAAGLVFLSALPSGRMLAAEASQPIASDPLLDIMIQKGMLTEDEAKKVKAQADALRTNQMASMPPMESKWKISKAIRSVELFGDLRLRYEYRGVQDPKGGSIELNRLRYAVRLGLRGDLFDDYYYGFRLDTAANPRSPWVTFGTSASGTPYQGPFGKSNAGIDIGQVYIGYNNKDWLEVAAGKMAQPLYTTPMVWDSDFAPEGLAEHFKHSVGQADFFANFAQLLYQDTNPTATSGGFFSGINNSWPSQGGGSSTPAFLLAWQAGVNYRFTTNISMKVAPVVYNYAGGSGVDTLQSGTLTAPGFNNTFVGQGATNGLVATGLGSAYSYGYSGYPNGPYDGFVANQTGINDLLVLEIPWEFNFKLAHFNARMFGDFAQNLEGSQRAKAAYSAANSALLAGIVRPISSPQTEDIHAYQIGFGLGNGDLGLVYGSTSKKHSWEARLYWQHVEQYALDPNLLDSDFFEGRGNLEGVYSALAYSFTDNVITTIRYGWAHRINNQLGTGGSNQDIPQMNPIDQYQLLQVDLTMRF